MDDRDIMAAIREAVDRESARKTYPEGFPVLPEMPSGRYHDPAFAALEMEHVWRKTWLWAAHMSELPRPGSYKLFEQLGLSIIVSRGTDDVVRAFRNVCRHRGAALVNEPAGTARRFTCPYHAWSYSTDGKLATVPEAQNFACLDKAEKPLMQVRCETWRGFVFINLDDNAGPLEEFMAPLGRQAEDFPFDEIGVKRIFAIELACNWKTAYDNFLEIYHVGVVHAQTIGPILDSKSFTVTLLKNGHACFTTRKQQAASLFTSDADTAEVSALFKEFTIAVPRFPNGFSSLDPAGVNWMAFWPIGPDRMALVSTILGPTMGDEAQDRAHWDRFVDFQMRIFNEDFGLFPSIQRSMASGELPALVLSCQEQHLHWYNEEIDRKIGPDNIPPHLRVMPVLASFAVD